MAELTLSKFGQKTIEPYSSCYYPKMSSSGLGFFKTGITTYVDNHGNKLYRYKCSKSNQVGIQISKVFDKSGGFSGMTGSAVVQLWGYADSYNDERGQMDTIQFVLPYIGASGEASMPYSCRYVPDNKNILDGELHFNVAYGTGRAITDFINSVAGSKAKINVGPTDINIPTANLTNSLYIAICCEYSGSTLISQSNNVSLQQSLGACVGNPIAGGGNDVYNYIDTPFEYEES